jgi:hypothetical protein
MPDLRLPDAIPPLLKVKNDVVPRVDNSRMRRDDVSDLDLEVHASPERPLKWCCSKTPAGTVCELQPTRL